MLEPLVTGTIGPVGGRSMLQFDDVRSVARAPLLRFSVMSELSTPPQHRWTLRAKLLGALVALVLIGAVVESTQPRASGQSTTTSSPSVTTSSLPQSSTTTVTTNPAHTTPSKTLNQRSRGCGLAASTPGILVTKVAIGHCSVLEIGDSLGTDLGWGLARELASTATVKLHLMDKSSTGLAATWFYNWPRQVKSMLAHFRPNLLVVCLGGNDEQGIRFDGRSYDFNTPQWRSHYAALIKQIDTLATRDGSYVLWVGLPIMAPTTYRAGVVALNSLYQSVAHRVPGVTYLSSWKLFSTARGQYRESAPVNHANAVLRSPDGIHFSTIGGDVFASFVANEIASIYHVIIHLDLPAYITQ